MMNLVIDIGNSRLKYALFSNSDCLCNGLGEGELFALMDRLNEENYTIFLSASGEISQVFLQRIRHYNREVTLFSRDMSLPIVIDYDTPNTLGLDRIANCVGALTVCAMSRSILVIDVGSAITYNYIEGGNRFVGGNISIGVGMRFKALNHFTAHLPLLGTEHHVESIGRSTETAIAAGVVEGVGHEIKGVIAGYIAEHPQGEVIITGGGYEDIVKLFKKEVRYIKNLGMIGLNAIYRFNFYN
ncbi:MAG: type III pantothenate kinase [Marinifilaceae bacterium]